MSSNQAPCIEIQSDKVAKLQLITVRVMTKPVEVSKLCSVCQDQHSVAKLIASISLRRDDLAQDSI